MRGAGNIKTIIFVTFINLFYLLAAWLLGLNRIWLNIDYIASIFLLSYGFKKTGLCLLIFAMVSDALLLMGQVFPFFRLDEIIYILKFIFISSLYYQLVFGVVLIIFILILFYYGRLAWNKKIVQYCFLLTAFLFSIETVFSGLHGITSNAYTRSLLLNFTEKQFFGFNQSLYASSQQLKNEPVSPTAQTLFNQIQHNEVLPNKILFIVAESLGVPKQQAVLDNILRPLLLQQNKAISKLEVKHLSYLMPTVYGELRELCHAQPQNLNLRDLDKGFENCLPNKLKKLNFKTSAYHGALSIMYDRKDWYPRAGFEKTFFYESKPWKSRCYSFPGICDTEISDAIAEQFKSNDKQFVYWLTLNSHAPYDLRDIQYDLLKCEEYDIDANSMSCRNLKLQAQFFYVLSKMIQQPQFSNTQVIIVGDHSPIIFDQTEKANVFDGNKVLMLKFNVK
ncbi:sulfatase-like hydrolase/transferase [Acinetobacter sp. YH01009]|uniref:sulfatase-like hydrolase/transferase n=1 Tax=Acinetobacter sp. YH01009 TaxID=2601025 RepID=UPI0015D2B360|nr:sulfatase-like hydrolase/transferase [Acinetobacter sp. YH01009]